MLPKAGIFPLRFLSFHVWFTQWRMASLVTGERRRKLYFSVLRCMCYVWVMSFCVIPQRYLSSSQYVLWLCSISLILTIAAFETIVQSRRAQTSHTSHPTIHSHHLISIVTKSHFTGDRGRIREHRQMSQISQMTSTVFGRKPYVLYTIYNIYSRGAGINRTNLHTAGGKGWCMDKKEEIRNAKENVSSSYSVIRNSCSVMLIFLPFSRKIV